MNVREKAVALHAEGLNCAQSVLCALEDYTHLPRELAEKIAEGFGGGVRCGEICGSVSGAVMALGMGKDSPVADTTRAFAQAFQKAQGCLRCQDLLAKYGGKGNCNEFIGFCAEEMEKILRDV